MIYFMINRIQHRFHCRSPLTHGYHFENILGVRGYFGHLADNKPKDHHNFENCCPREE